MKSSLKKRYLVKLLANIISALVGAIVVAIVPSALGPSSYGKFIFIQQFFSNTFGFLDFGTSITFYTKISRNPERKELILFYFMISMVILSIAILFTQGAYFFELDSYIFNEISQYYVYLGLFFGFFTWASSAYIRVFDAYLLTVQVEIIKILYKLGFLVSILLFTYVYHLNLEMFLWLSISSLLIFILTMNRYLIKKSVVAGLFSRKKVNYKDLIIEFKEFCAPIASYGIVLMLVGIADIWLLQYVSGLEEMGFYGASFQIGAIGFMITSAMIPIINREFAYCQENNDSRQIRSLFKKYIPMFFSLSALMSIYVAFQADNIIGLFLDDRYNSAYVPLILLSFFFTYLAYTRIIETILFSFQKTKEYRNIGLIYNIFGVALSFLFIFIFEFGATGLAIKMLLTQLFGSSIILYFSSKIVEVKASSIFKHQIISIFLLALIGYLAILITPQFQLYILNMAFYGVVYFGLAILATYIYPNLFSLTRQGVDTQILLIKQRLYKFFYL